MKHIVEKLPKNTKVTGEERLKYERKQITKVIDSYTVDVKKEGIIVGHLP